MKVVRTERAPEVPELVAGDKVIGRGSDWRRRHTVISRESGALALAHKGLNQDDIAAYLVLDGSTEILFLLKARAHKFRYEHANGDAIRSALGAPEVGQGAVYIHGVAYIRVSDELMEYCVAPFWAPSNPNTETVGCYYRVGNGKLHCRTHELMTPLSELVLENEDQVLKPQGPEIQVGDVWWHDHCPSTKLMRINSRDLSPGLETTEHGHDYQYHVHITGAYRGSVTYSTGPIRDAVIEGKELDSGPWELEGGILIKTNVGTRLSLDAGIQEAIRKDFHYPIEGPLAINLDTRNYACSFVKPELHKGMFKVK